MQSEEPKKAKGEGYKDQSQEVQRPSKVGLVENQDKIKDWAKCKKNIRCKQEKENAGRESSNHVPATPEKVSLWAPGCRRCFPNLNSHSCLRIKNADDDYDDGGDDVGRYRLSVADKLACWYTAEASAEREKRNSKGRLVYGCLCVWIVRFCWYHGETSKCSER